MKKYATYKESGIDWLGVIPEHWSSKRLKDFLERNDGGVWGQDDFDEQGKIVLRSTEIQIDGSWLIENPATRILTDNEIERSMLDEGDLLVTKSSGSEKHIGKTARVGKDIEKLSACFSNFMQRLRLKDKKYSLYYFHFLNSYVAREQYNYLSETTTGLANLNAEILSLLKICIPPENEVESISNYLNERTTKLDELIKNKEAQIKQMKEIMQIEISTAVTKGLSPKAKMKKSGIEWLDEIPEHWEVNRIKNIVSLRAKKELEYKDDEFLVALENIESWAGRYIDTQPEFDIGGIRFNKGDVLFGKLRPYLAKVYLAEEEGVCVSEILAINTGQRVLSKFFFYRLLSSDFISIVNSSTYGAKMPRANWQFISNLKMPYPKNKEQEKIIKYLDDRISSITKLLDNLDSQLERLKEIRKIEIYNAVTGKIKVV